MICYDMLSFYLLGTKAWQIYISLILKITFFFNMICQNSIITLTFFSGPQESIELINCSSRPETIKNLTEKIKRKKSNINTQFTLVSRPPRVLWSKQKFKLNKKLIIKIWFQIFARTAFLAVKSVQDLKKKEQKY